MSNHYQLLELLRSWQELRSRASYPGMEAFAKAYQLHQDYIKGLLEKLSAFDPSLLNTAATDCLLEVDQTGEVSLDAFLAPEGKNSESSGFYLSFRPGHSFIGLGYLANTMVNSFAIHQEQKLQGEEWQYMLHFLTTCCGFELLSGRLPPDLPTKNRLINLGIEKRHLRPMLLFKYIPHEELMDSQLENWLVQQYGLLLSYNQYLNRALDFYAHTRLDELEDHVDLP